MKPFRIVLSLILALLFISADIALQTVEAQTQTGKVVGVSDGDTVTILVDKTQVRVRLYGIDAPEGGQDFGRRAKEFASQMVFGKIVTMEVMDIDRYGMTVANILVDGKSLNEELVKAGYAWVYPQYCKIPVCKEWYQYEAEARVQKIGLWSHPNPIPPWDFRRGKHRVSTGIYHGNTRSMVFHQSTCEHFNCKNCTEVFQRREDALKAGYRPCGGCRP